MYKFITPNEAREILKVSDSTLRRWADEGKITYVQEGKFAHRRYNITNLLEKRQGEGRIKVCYCRVSTRDQKGDLERQVKFMQEKFPDHEIITDFGSGLNFKRKGLKTILDKAIQANLEQVVVTHKDRLCRFGFDLIQYILKETSNAEIMVLDEKIKTAREELVEDLLSITTVFSSRLYGMRRKNKKTTPENT